MSITNNKTEKLSIGTYILVTGAAGFIGYHLCEALLRLGHQVVGLDNINNYYDVNLKYARLKQLGVERDQIEDFNQLRSSSKYGESLFFIRMNLEDQEQMTKLFEQFNFTSVCNLAAQVGVRNSIKNPKDYVSTNVNGFLTVLECCKAYKIDRLVYASSSSVYGNSSEVPFVESANVDNPISMYASTKKTNELMAHTYSVLYGIETIGLRFFTVYGPWSRPDMAMFLFTDAILNDRPIKVFNKGELSRDFTFVDDIVNGIVMALTTDSKNTDKNKLYNIGNGKPVRLLDFIEAIEKELGVEAKKVMYPMQAGDVNETWASTKSLENDYGYTPKVDIAEGVAQFIAWYKSFYSN
jgi:UDP-glucuronate 4-epimerase